MEFNNQTKAILVIGGIFLLILIVYLTTWSVNKKKDSENENENFDVNNNNLPDNIEENGEETEYCPENETNNGQYMDSFETDQYDSLQDNLDSKNRAKNGYKRVSYSGDRRGNDGGSWSAFFDCNNNILASSQNGDGANFTPIDINDNTFAVFESTCRETCGSNQDCEPEDLFNIDKYLPQEVNDKWFDIVPEPISVKNRHLINITKPIGVNTIGQSLKNPTYDIRGAPPNPKFVVSPFLNSTIEPDTNLKGLC